MGFLLYRVDVEDLFDWHHLSRDWKGVRDKACGYLGQERSRKKEQTVWSPEWECARCRVQWEGVGWREMRLWTRAHGNFAGCMELCFILRVMGSHWKALSRAVTWPDLGLNKIDLSCSFYCLSVTFQFSGSIAASCSPLFSVATRHLKYLGSLTVPSQVRKIPVPWAALQKPERLDSHSSFSFPRELAAPLLFFVLHGSQASKLRQFHQFSERGNIKTSPPGSPPRSWNIGHMLYSSLSTWRWSNEPGCFFLVLSCASLGEGLMWVK